MSRRKSKRLGPPFVRLFWHLLDSQAWHELSPHARLAFIELARLYDGSNNGRIAMSARRLGHFDTLQQGYRCKVLRELEDSGFIETIKFGKFTRKQEDRRAS